MDIAMIQGNNGMVVSALGDSLTSPPRRSDYVNSDSGPVEPMEQTTTTQNTMNAQNRRVEGIGTLSEGFLTRRFID
jgi:hypothetical protein